MSWMQKLYNTYEKCAGAELDVGEPMMPVSHTMQQAHIEIVVDGGGNFRRARVVSKEATLLPATEKSAGRTSGEAAHPLCDKIQYCAGDYAGESGFGGRKPSYFNSYREQLQQWCESEYRHPMAIAILSYINKSSLVKDLVEAQVLIAKDGVLVELRETKGKKDRIEDDLVSEDVRQAEIFKQLTAKDSGNEKIKDQGDALVRWCVEDAAGGNLESATWKDHSLMESWVQYYSSLQTEYGFCMVTGRHTALAIQHPAKLRNANDKTKLISTNDTSGYTFRGRFLSAAESLSVGFEVSQKAHNALRWLIERQGGQGKNGDQTIVSWAVSGKPLPNMVLNSFDLLGLDGIEIVSSHSLESGQAFALRLKKSIAGYGSRLDPNEDVVVMALDSTSGNNGRLSIVFYRELQGSEFLQRIESWHQQCAWPQNFGKEMRFIGAPSPRDIAEAAYGRRLDDKLRKATVERMLPCIVDGLSIPRDLVESTRRRACNRVGLEPWEWEKCLGIACSLYKAFNKNRSYDMSLETDRVTRDYLYGRLLAIAEKIESIALSVAGEKRDTTAARLMQRFSDRPFSTWKSIELGLTPYKARLRTRRAGFLVNMEKLLDEVSNAFVPQDFISDKPLSGEFLLGYHCQRSAFKVTELTIESSDSFESTQNA